MRKNNKGQIQIPFAWLFAIIVGTTILFLAIFATTKIVKTEQIVLDAQTAKQIGILLNPLETGFESGKTTSMTLATETRIHNRCNNEDNFGKQIIRVSQKSFNKWTDTDVNIGFSNKHIFSDNYVEGRKFFLFSKPFEFPYKIADVIYLTSSEKIYCFEDAPLEIENELSNLNQKNLLLEGCPKNSIKVCFFGSGCDIEVNVGSRFVDKNSERMYFDDDALMYAAIFSDPEIYECQVKRLMQRGEQTTQLYFDKASFVSREGCNTNLNLDLLKSRMSNFEWSVNLNNAMINIKEDIQEKNKLADCKLW